MKARPQATISQASGRASWRVFRNLRRSRCRPTPEPGNSRPTVSTRGGNVKNVTTKVSMTPMDAIRPYSENPRKSAATRARNATEVVAAAVKQDQKVPTMARDMARLGS